MPVLGQAGEDDARQAYLEGGLIEAFEKYNLKPRSVQEQWGCRKTDFTLSSVRFLILGALQYGSGGEPNKVSMSSCQAFQKLWSIHGSRCLQLELVHYLLISCTPHEGT